MTTTPKLNPDTIIPERAPSLGVPLRFFLTGALFLGALLLLALQRAPMLTQDYLGNPVTLAVTHLFTLGFGSSVVTGAVYQIVPVLLYSSLFSERMANLHLGVHAAGVIAMVTGFSGYNTLLVIVGGTLVTAGALLFVINLVLTFRAAERWNWHGFTMVAALLFYLCTLGFGLVMAFNQRLGFLDSVEGAPLGAHLALGLVGWFGLMIVGVGMKLIPMFAPAKPLPPRGVAAVGGGLALGVALTVAGLLTVAGAGAGSLGRWLLWLGLGLMAAGLLGYTAAVLDRFRQRRAGPLDFSVRFAVTAAALLPVPVLGFLPAGRELQAGLVFLFGMTFIGGTILGMLLRIIPFMVWLHRFRHRVHKQEKIPFLHEMFHHRLGWAAYVGWFSGGPLLAAGVALTSTPLVQIGAATCLAALLSFAAAVGQVLLQVKPGTPALYPGKRA